MRETEQNHRRLCGQGKSLRRPSASPLSVRCWLATATVVLALAAGTLISGTGSARADDLKSLGDFGDWSAYLMSEGGKKVCFMASEPVKAEGDYTQRGDIHLLVTHRPADKSVNEISVVTGYPYKEDSSVDLAIGKKTWRLFTKGERAWAWDRKDDTAIVAALRKGSNMVVKGTSQRGTVTTDTYSLRGSSAAYEAISTACGVPVE